MNFKSLFILMFLVLFSLSLFPQQDTNKVNKGKMLVVSSALGLALTGSYLYIENSWWADKQIPFHFDDGADLKYALNVDKAGHFMGGIESADLFSQRSIRIWAKDWIAVRRFSLFGMCVSLWLLTTTCFSNR